MRLDKWAVTAQEALQAALGIAGDAEASEVAPTHLLKALLDSNERNLRSTCAAMVSGSAPIFSKIERGCTNAPALGAAGQQ